MIKLCDAITGDPIMELKGHTGWISGSEFSPYGKTVVSASLDKTSWTKKIAIRPQGGDFVFTSVRDGGLTPAGVYQIFRRIASESNAREKWSPHQWRHWRARK